MGRKNRGQSQKFWADHYQIDFGYCILEPSERGQPNTGCGFASSSYTQFVDDIIAEVQRVEGGGSGAMGGRETSGGLRKA